MRPTFLLFVGLTLLTLADAAQAKCDAAAGFSRFRQVRDHRAEAEALIDRHRRQRHRLDMMHAEHGRVPSFHASLDFDLLTQSLGGFQLCTPDGNRRSASIDRFDVGLSLAVEVPRHELELRVFTQSKRTRLVYDLPAPEPDFGEFRDPPTPIVAAGTNRQVVGGVLRVTRWFELGVTWFGSGSGRRVDRRDPDSADAPVPVVMGDLDTEFWALALGVPALRLQVEMLIDPASGDVIDTGLRMRDVELEVAKLSGGVRWDDIDETLRIGAHARRLLGAFQVGVELQTNEIVLRSARAGLDLHWAGGVSTSDLNPGDPNLLVFGYLGAQAVGTTYDSAATRAVVGQDERLHGGEIGLEAGAGMPPLGITFGLLARLSYNRPGLLDAMPMMANRFEGMVGITTRVGY